MIDDDGGHKSNKQRRMATATVTAWFNPLLTFRSYSSLFSLFFFACLPVLWMRTKLRGDLPTQLKNVERTPNFWCCHLWHRQFIKNYRRKKRHISCDVTYPTSVDVRPLVMPCNLGSWYGYQNFLNVQPLPMRSKQRRQNIDLSRRIACNVGSYGGNDDTYMNGVVKILYYYLN